MEKKFSSEVSQILSILQQMQKAQNLQMPSPVSF